MNDKAPETAGERLLKHLKKPNMLKDRWYFIEVYPRDVQYEQHRFVGKLIAEDEKEDEHLFQDQDGWWYYLRDVTKFNLNDDSITIRSEWAERGQTISEIFEQLSEIYEGRENAPKCPLLSELRRKEEIGDIHLIPADDGRDTHRIRVRP
jgi:hypothetical protein